MFNHIHPKQGSVFVFFQKLEILDAEKDSGPDQTVHKDVNVVVNKTRIMVCSL